MLASYPGHMGGEKQLGIDSLYIRGHFSYISVKFNIHIACPRE